MFIACPHFKISIRQRSKGQSAVAGAAYQAGENLFSEYDLKRKRYRYKAPEVMRKEILLPSNAPPEQYASLVRDYCMEQFVSKGMCCDFAVHDKGDGNPHAHIMPTMRAMDENGKRLPKARKVYSLDENGEKIRLPSGELAISNGFAFAN